MCIELRRLFSNVSDIDSSYRMEIISAKSKVRPFLRWAGSKRQLLPEMSKYWGAGFKRYVEPFAGSACFFFDLQPERALLGDLNDELIATYLEIKYRVTDLVKELSKLEEGKESYYRLRETDVTTLDRAQKAARFIYLNRYCFNGLYRTNRSGKFNVPFGGSKTGLLPDKLSLEICSRLLKNTRLISGHFEKVLKKVELGDFVYMDPPFRVKEQRVFNEYNALTFGVKDLVALRKWMEELANKNIAFLVSYAESDEASVLYEGFDRQVVRVKRNIAGFADSRVHANEVLISFRPMELGANNDRAN